jgi:two-component system, OmpR family, phosphate regulon sensor histidine kinase PhoR
VRLINPALCQMLGIDGSAVGRSLLEAIRHAELKGLLDHARESGELATGEIALGGAGSRRCWLRAAPMSGPPAGLLVVFVDVTELRRLETMRRDFVANASHEIRTPVTAILSAAETLRDAAARDPAGAERFLEIIVRNAERLELLVRDLLELSRIEAQRTPLELERLEVDPGVTATLALFQERAERRRMTLRQELGAGPLVVRANRRALEQCLGNLIDNAIKYCPEGSAIVVGAALAGDRVRFSVVDNGPGIPALHLSRIFERFYRVDAGRSRELGGTGLGLAIVKHLVEALGGSVEVESMERRGSTFSFTLPLA